MSTLRIAVVGLRFGAAFAHLYRLHPDVAEVVVCDPDAAVLAQVARDLGGARTLPSLEAVLADPAIDGVHLCTPIPLHVPQALACLQAGKHVACAVPASTDIDDCGRLVAAEQRSGRRYFMAETQNFSAEFFLVRDLIAQGRLGRLQYLKGAHHQNMDSWPGYWKGLPPMWYATHALMPLLAIAGAPITHVSCMGSGSIRQELADCYGSPFACETAIFRFANGLAAQVERTLFESATPGCESFEVFGSQAGFSANRIIRLTGQVAHWGRGLTTTTEHVHPPQRLDLLPPAFALKLLGTAPGDPAHPAHDGHGGSHPHLVNEFVGCIRDDRPSAIPAAAAAGCCAAALIAHQSALQGGVLLPVPAY